MPQFIEEETAEEETAEEELYWGSELCWEYSEPSHHQHHQPYNHGVQIPSDQAKACTG